MKELLAVLAMIFLAELGNKTQLATMAFATNKLANPMLVFVGASFALIAASGISVLIGHTASHYLAALPIRLVAGLGFIAIGVWSILEHFEVMT